MTAGAIQLAVLEGVKVVHRSSDALTPKFLEVGVGTITLSDVGGALDFGGATVANQSLTNGYILIGNDDDIAASVAVTGAIAITNAGVVTINNDAVGTPQILNGAVTTLKLSTGLQTQIADHESRITSLEFDVQELQSAVAAIQNNTPEQDIQAGADIAAYTAAGPLTFDADNTILDIDVYVDGRLQTQDITGDSLNSYKKTSTTALLFTENVPAGKEIKIFKRGTSTGPTVGSGPGVDLTAITVNPAPSVAGDQSLGTPSKPWRSLFIKDKNSAQVYELEIVDGDISFTPI